MPNNKAKTRRKSKHKGNKNKQTNRYKTNQPPKLICSARSQHNISRYCYTNIHLQHTHTHTTQSNPIQFSPTQSTPIHSTPIHYLLPPPCLFPIPKSQESISPSPQLIFPKTIIPPLPLPLTSLVLPRRRHRHRHGPLLLILHKLIQRRTPKIKRRIKRTKRMPIQQRLGRRSLRGLTTTHRKILSAHPFPPYIPYRDKLNSKLTWYDNPPKTQSPQG